MAEKNTTSQPQFFHFQNHELLHEEADFFSSNVFVVGHAVPDWLDGRVTSSWVGGVKMAGERLSLSIFGETGWDGEG